MVGLDNGGKVIYYLCELINTWKLIQCLIDHGSFQIETWRGAGTFGADIRVSESIDID